MKRTLLFFFLLSTFFLSAVAQKNNPLNVEILNTKIVSKNEIQYPPSTGIPSDIRVISQYLQSGSWQMLMQHFKSKGAFNSFMDNFTYNVNDPRIAYLSAGQKSSPFSRLKPYHVREVKDNRISLINANDNTVKNIDFTFTKNNNQLLILEASVSEGLALSNKEDFFLTANNNPTDLQASISETVSSLNISQTNSDNFILLSSSASEEPKYYDDYLKYFNQDKETGSQVQEVVFRQIDFASLEIQFRWCKRVLGINVCGTETKEYEYGKVISGKDIPGNEVSFADPYFGNVEDMTAYSTNLSSSDFTPGNNNYILTSVIVDRADKKLCFFREGLEPWNYGHEPGEEPFIEPIAIKEIGGYLYVLDRGRSGYESRIKVFKVFNNIVNNSDQGGFGVNYIGSIMSSNLGGFTLAQPNDIGGFEGAGGSDPNVLLISDHNGIHAVDLSPASGMVSSSTVRSFSYARDVLDYDKSVSLNKVRKLDGRKPQGGDYGTVVLIMEDNSIIAFSASEVSSSNTNDYVQQGFQTRLDFQYNPNNLAYMFTEEKWYMTDYNGKFHALTKDGRYIGAGGSPGISEDNGELYFPNVITPNRIEDPNSAYRYRFIVGNKWAYETGFKLFAPSLNIPNFRIFEKTSNGDLSFAFTTSGKWQAVEHSTGMSFTGLLINGISVNSSLWNTQIVSGDQLTNFPNVFTIGYSSLPLKRGWNTAEVSLIIYKQGEPNETVKKEIDFYWLPSSFTPTTLNNGSFKLNQFPTIGANNIDFIYKPITIGNNGALYVPSGGNVIVIEQGSIDFNSGSTFYNVSPSEEPLSNIHFEGPSAFHVHDNAYVCISVGSTAVPVRTLESLKDVLILDANYKLGVNPPGLPEYSSANCQSPCYLYDKSSPKVSFSATVDYTSGPNFTVTADPSATTYANKFKWEVENVTEGSTAGYQSLITDASTSQINLTTAFSYTFAPCSEYKITLSIGCNETDWVESQSVTISTAPVVSAGPDQNVCDNIATVTLTGSPAGGSWSGTGVSSAGIFTTNLVSLSIPQTLTYTYTDDWECTRSDDKNIIVYPVPAAPFLSSNSPVCEDQTLILSTASVSGATYNFSSDNRQFGNSANPGLSLSSLNTTYSGNYFLTITVHGCASPAGSASVTVNPLPVVDAGPDEATCITTSSFIVAGASPSGGSWSGPGINTTGTFTPSEAGYGIHTLTYTFTDNNGCTNHDTKKVTVGPIINLGADLNTCLNLPSFMLSGYSPSGGTWSGSGVSSLGEFDPAASGLGSHLLTYTFTDPNGCINSATKTLIVYEVPATPSVSATSEGCLGSNLTFHASTISGATYIWTGPNGFSAQEQNPTIFALTGKEGTYSVRSSINGCLSDLASTEAIVHLPPDVDAGANLVTCKDGDPLILTGTPSEGTWSGTGVTNNTFVPSSLEGSYTLNYSVTDVNGCIGSDSRDVTVAFPLSVNIISTVGHTFCQGTFTSATLVADAVGADPFTFQWSRNGTSISGAKSQIYTATQAGNYCVTVTDLCGSVSACYNIDIINNPIITLSPASSTICTGDFVTLSASGAGTGGSYLWTPAASLNTTSGSVVNAYPVTGTTYTVTGKDANGCIASATATVNLYPTLNFSASASSSTICLGSSVSLNASGGPNGSIYTWTWGGKTRTGSLITDRPVITTIYKVTATLKKGNSGSCAVKYVTVIVNPIPAITTAPSAESVCYSAGAQITTLAYSAKTNSPTTYSIIWNATPKNNFAAVTGASLTESPIYISVPGNTAAGYNYTGTITVNANGCLSRGTSFTVKVNPLPTITGQSMASATYCQNQSSQPLSVTATGTSLTYQWYSNSTASNSGGVLIGGATSSNYAPSTDVEGIFYYYCKITESGLCSVSSLVSGGIVINAAPVITASSDLTLCPGGNVVLSLVNSSTGQTYQWLKNESFIPDETNSYYTASSAGTYTLIVSGSACPSNPLKVKIAQPVKVTPSSATICQGNSVQLTATGASFYVWTPLNGLTFTNNITKNKAKASPASTTTYLVTGNNNPCPAQVTVNVIQPVTAAASPSTICYGSSTTLSASGGGASTIYVWTVSGASVGTGKNINVSPTSTTTYTVNGINQGACVTPPAQITVTVTPGPQIVASSTLACQGESIKLSFTAPEQQGDSWQWYENETSIAGATNSTYAYTLTAAANYHAVVTNGGQTCTSNTVSISLKPENQCCLPANVLGSGATQQALVNGVMLPLSPGLGSYGTITTIDAQGGTIVFDGTYHVTGTIKLINGTFKVLPGTDFYIDRDGGLNFSFNNCYLGINGNLTFILIDQAKLIVNGGAFTSSSCNHDTWGGIAFSNYSEIQTDEGQFTSQGIVTTRNSLFQDMQFGIISYDVYSCNTEINNNNNRYYFKNTDFRDNLRSFFDLNKGQAIAGEGFTFCNFTCDPYRRTTFPFFSTEGISMIGVNSTDYSNANFSNNNFENLLFGINGSMSFGTIKENTFNVKETAIALSPIGLSNLVTIKDNLITVPSDYWVGPQSNNIPRGIVSSSSIIEGNIITGDNITNKKQFGIYTSGNSIIRDNEISFVEDAITVIQNSLNTFNDITNNELFNNDREMIFPDVPYTVTNVSTLCNTFDNSGLSGTNYGIFVEENAFLNNLGDATHPNGNAFVGFSGTKKPFEYRGTSQDDFRYYRSTSPQENIQVTNGFTILQNAVQYASGSSNCSGPPGVASPYKLAVSSPLSAEDSVNAAMDSLRFQLGSFRKMKTWQYEILSYHEKNNNLDELYSYCDSLKGCNLEAYNTFMLYLMNKYDHDNQCSKSHQCADEVLNANPDDKEIQARTAYFNYECRQRHGVQRTFILPFMPMDTQDSTDLTQVAGSETSLSEIACMKLRMHDSKTQCSAKNTYVPNYPDCGEDCKKKKKEFLKKGWENQTGFKADKQDGQLSQNIPNPAYNETMIPYLIPSDNFESAYITIQSVVNGNEVRKILLTQAGYSAITVNLENLPNGVYTYTLVVDGIKQDLKRMVVVK